MSRVNWMNIATGAVLVVSLLFAFAYGWYQWGHAQRARQAQEEVRRQVALAERELMARRESYRTTLGKIAAPDTREEDAAFLNTLQVLMAASGVKQVQMDRARVEPLPSITRVTGANTAGSAPADANTPPEPSITNLPLGVRAIATNLVVQGTLSSIRLFLYQLQSLRYRSRAVNVNSLQISLLDDRGTLRASMMLTRFVRPESDPLRPIGAEEDTGLTRLPQSSPAIEMSRPDTPAQTGP
ncbi:MAG: hypothetical protein RMJ43_01105 [Chloroherpetonaceae bacterium]|nr:hypothetical protein [Chthonomonadaceae bacterium]MDW8206407.1 hypothetical protein [Chloroherpetonaceae bacterium]